MKPIGKYIVVKNIDEDIKTESGLILSGDDVNQLRYRLADVVEPGTEVACINAGDRVYYDKGTSFTMIIGEGHYTIIQERDVVVVV